MTRRERTLKNMKKVKIFIFFLPTSEDFGNQNCDEDDLEDKDESQGQGDGGHQGEYPDDQDPKRICGNYHLGDGTVQLRKCNRCRKVKEFARLFKLSSTSLPQVDTNGARSCSEGCRAKNEERHGEYCCEKWRRETALRVS